MLRTPGKQVVVVSSRKHIKELNQASPAALSMHAMAKEVQLSIIQTHFANPVLMRYTADAAPTYHARLRHE